MTESYRYDVEVLHLLVSPAHAYFGRAREGAADVPTTDTDTVEFLAGNGIVGDRFFGKAAHMDAAVTLLSVEALEAMAAELGAGPRVGDRAGEPARGSSHRPWGSKAPAAQARADDRRGVFVPARQRQLGAKMQGAPARTNVGHET